jgi:hypothetical protein
VVEQEVATQGIKISRGGKLVLITRQETIILPRAKPIVQKLFLWLSK